MITVRNGKKVGKKVDQKVPCSNHPVATSAGATCFFSGRRNNSFYVGREVSIICYLSI